MGHSKSLSRSRLALVSLALAGCEACGGGERTAVTPTETPRPTSATPEAPVGPPPEIRLRVESTLDRSAQVVLEVRGTDPVELATAMEVERRVDGDYQAVSDSPMALRFDCEQDVGRCITLVPGAAFHPPVWTPKTAQCGCEDCVDHGAGPFRFLVTTCDGAHRAASDDWDPGPR